MEDSKQPVRADAFTDSPFFGGFPAARSLAAAREGEDGGHQGVVDACGPHGVARRAAWIHTHRRFSPFAQDNPETLSK